MNFLNIFFIVYILVSFVLFWVMYKNIKRVVKSMFEVINDETY